jgi:hypothetical protein
MQIPTTYPAVAAAITSQIGQLQNDGWRAMTLAPKDEEDRVVHLAILARHRGEVLGTAIAMAAHDASSVTVSKRAAVHHGLCSTTVIAAGGFFPTLSDDLAKAMRAEATKAIVMDLTDKVKSKAVKGVKALKAAITGKDA